MKERPILFSAPMVRALLAGTKTQTRRIAKPVRHPDWGNLYSPGALVREHEPMHVIHRACPYGQPGDQLWVRETWLDLQGTGIERVTGDLGRYAYAADTPPGSHGDECRKNYGLKWSPSIHMPRAASRITLEITGVRVERLKDISEDDAVAEGIECHEHAVGIIGTRVDTVRCIHCGSLRRDHVGVAMACFGGSGTVWNGNTARGGFSFLWESINGVGSWTVNPWVWVLEFKRIEGQTK